MTYYLIAKNEAGQIVAKRVSQSRAYAYATVRGTFHSRLDLVPAGQKAYKVEEIPAAEYRALVKAGTDAPDRLRLRLAKAEKSVEHYTARIARAEARARADVSALPRRERTIEWSRDRTIVEYEGEWHPAWTFEPDRIADDISSARHWLAEAEKSVASTRKRLAAAERKAAKAS